MNICKFLKRSLSLLLVLMMCVSLMSLSAFAANEETPTQYACGLEEHEHTDECYATQTVDTLICELEESEGHQHDSSCYETQTTETEEQVLTCDEEHEHTEDCYAVQTVTVEEEVLTCQLAEAEGHAHSEDCYETTTVTTLACGKEEHTHTAECVAEETAVEEIPADVQAFLDAVARIPSEITLDDADAIMAASAAWDDLDWRNVDREDVQEANDIFTAAFMRLLELEEAPETALLADYYGVYMITYPRAYANSDNSWYPYRNNSDLATWTKKWASTNSGRFNFHGIGNYEGDKVNQGQIAYCIEHGINQGLENPDLTANNPASLNRLSSDQQTQIGRILAYGYTGNIRVDWYPGNSSDRDTLARAMATQLLIWETLGQLQSWETEIPSTSPMHDYVSSAYTTIKNNVENHTKLPSFCSSTQTLDWNGTMFSLTLTDSNKVLANYNVACDDTNVQCSISGNQLKITSAKPISSSVTITLTGKTAGYGLVVWGDGKSTGSTNVQDVVTYGKVSSDCTRGSFTVKTSTKTVSGSVVKYATINNEQTQIPVAGATIGLYADGSEVDRQTTGNDGKVSFTWTGSANANLTVKEISAPTGYQNNNTTDIAFNGSAVTIYDKGSLSVTIHKVEPADKNLDREEKSLSGVTFSLWYADTKVAEGSTNASGDLTFNNLIPGTYTLKETKPNGYVAVDDMTVTVLEDGTVICIDGAVNGTTITINNTHEVANLNITKTVTWNPTSSQTPPAGSVFTFEVTLGDSNTARTDNTYAGAGVYTLSTKLTQADIDNAVTNADDTKTATCTVQTITGIPTGTTYTVVEHTDVIDSEGNTVEGFTQDGYVNSEDTIAINAESAATTVKNRYFKTVLTSIDGYKDWVGVPENLWPESITVALYQDGTKFDTQNVYAPENGCTKWTYSWKDLPQYKAENDEYTYTVKEVSVNYGEDSVYTADAREENTDIIRVRSNIVAENGTDKEILGGWIITDGQNMNVVNKWLPASELGNTSFTIEKLDSLEETPINGVTFKLTKTENGVADGTDEDGNDAVRELTTGEEGIVKFSYLTDGTYTLTEIAVPEGYRTDDINVGRTWTINIIKENLATVDEIDGPNILGENTWNWKPVDDNGEDAGTLTITNAPIMGQISVTKTLDLDGVTDGITGEPADKVFTFEVWATEDVLGADLTEPVAILTVKMGETATTDPLRYGTYIVKEVGNPEELTDYKWQSVTYTQGSIDSATEEMVNNLAEAVTDALNEVLDRETEEDVTTESADTVMVGKQDVTYAVTATNHYERDLGELSISKTVQGDLGDQNKEWHFTITLTSPEEYVQLAEQYEVTYSANKSVADEEAEDAEEVEPDYLTFTAQEDGTYVSAEIVLKHGETATIQGIPVGTTYKVTEAEANKDGYSTSATDDTGVIVTGATEAKFYNSRWSVPTTSLTVNKVWEDDGHEDERPDSIQVQLYRNGNAYGNPVTLNADNGWSQRWTGLSTNGAWTVEELNVPHGYTVTMEQSGTVVTITNTYEEEEEEDLDDPDVPLAEMPDDPEEPDDSDDSDNSDGPDEEFLDDPDVPLAGVPDMPEEEELDDPDVPLAEMPGAPEEEELDDPDVPLAEMPGVPEEEDQEELEELTDLDVPLAEVPKTGDRSGLWYALSAAAAAGLLGLTAVERKKREED